MSALLEDQYDLSAFSSQTTLGLVDDDSKFVGTLHADDLFAAIQSKNPLPGLSTNSCSEDASLDEVLKQIGSAGSHVAILNSYGQLTGIITKDDVVSALIPD